MWALFRDDVQISKAHPHKASVLAEAYERNLVVRGVGDFPDGENLCVTVSLVDGVDIRSVDNQPNS